MGGHSPLIGLVETKIIHVSFMIETQIDTFTHEFLPASRLLLERLAKGCDEVPPD